MNVDPRRDERTVDERTGGPIAVAWRYTAGPHALAEVDALATALERCHLYPATRADLLRTAEARAANRRALELTANPAEQAELRRRIDWGDDAG